MITAESLSYTVNTIEILRDVSLTVETGEFVGVIGPNGAGKTTLLKQMLGLIKPTAGRVLLHGESLDALDPKERARQEAYLSQDVMTSFPYPVIDIVLMGRYPYLGRFGRESENDMEIARRALAYVGMQEFEHRSFGELSGGERQLVLFAKVLAQDARLLILDEPTSNLDIRHQDLFFSMAAELAGEQRAVVAAVHNLDIASRYCGRLVLLHRGSIAADGAPSEVLNPEVLDPVYGIRTTISTNTATGSLMVDVVPRKWSDDGPRVHLIGGAGSAINLTRDLARLSCRITGGVSHEYDADEQLWKTLSIPYFSIEPFSHVEAGESAQVASWIAEADYTILCDFPVGPGNIGNFDLARQSPNLIIIEEDESSRRRSYFIDGAEDRFQEIKNQAQIMTYTDVVDFFREKALS